MDGGIYSKRPAYSGVEKLLHWLSALAVAFVVAIALWGAQLQPGPTKLLLGRLHLAVGILILLLTAWRATIRLIRAREFDLHPLVRGIHMVLYGLLLAIPLTGLATAIRSNGIYILLNLPTTEGFDPGLASDVASLHITLAYALVGLLVAHIGAAIWHHLVLKDAVMSRMLPS